jgi:hypothetical protein
LRRAEQRHIDRLQSFQPEHGFNICPPMTKNKVKDEVIVRQLNLDRWLDQIIAEVSDGDKEELLEPSEVATRLRVSNSWLDIARSKNGGYGPKPTYLESKGNPVTYRRGDLLSWLRARKKEKAQRDKQRELA